MGNREPMTRLMPHAQLGTNACHGSEYMGRYRSRISWVPTNQVLDGRSGHMSSAGKDGWEPGRPTGG